MFRDFCDAEAVLLSYSPFNWKEWSFTIEQVQLIAFMHQNVSYMYVCSVLQKIIYVLIRHAEHS